MASVWYLSFKKKKISFEKYSNKKNKKKKLNKKIKKPSKKKKLTSLFFILPFFFPINLIFGKIQKEKKNEK
jgi:hypothetical protein